MTVSVEAWAAGLENFHKKQPQMSALDVQVGGDHYKERRIQPIEYIHANNLNYSEGAIVKYITRWREKNGFEDLEKIKHYVDLLIELEQKYKR